MKNKGKQIQSFRKEDIEKLENTLRRIMPAQTIGHIKFKDDVEMLKTFVKMFGALPVDQKGKENFSLAGAITNGHYLSLEEIPTEIALSKVNQKALAFIMTYLVED